MQAFDAIERCLFPMLQDKPLQENFRLGIEGASYSQFEGRNAYASSADMTIRYIREEEIPDGRVKYYAVSGIATLEVAVTYRQMPGGAIKQTVCVKNTGDAPATINHLSSATLDGIGQDGLLKWYDPKRYILHTCDTVWQGECQWRHRTLSEVGLVPTTTHINMKTFKVDSIGSWTTARNYPILILEDTETGRSFYLELEPAGTWEIELFNFSRGFAQDGCLGIEANCANIHHDGWQVTLQPGQTFTAQPCVYGVTDGGFEEAVAALLAYKRADSLVHFAPGKIPVVFNCYMDCIFSNPTTETLLPLVDACAKVGVDVFCIDAGWFRCFDDPSKNAIGDYNIAEDRFPGYGLQGILDEMRKKGITPGIWIEAECCQTGAAYHMAPDCLCERNGKPIGGTRAFFNFREESVRDYLMKLIDRLYTMGVRYIKNDYNQTTGIGFSNYGEAYGKESADSVLAMLAFFDAVKAKYPDLWIENCGSGGMREDHNTLRHFDLQSTSDQELYFRNPSIISGTLACMAPEKAGAWAYPYPVYLNGEEKHPFADLEFWDAKREKYADGEETVFNLVNGMLANLYLSGRIDQCDAFNRKLIRSAIALYKANQTFLQRAVPIYPTGTFLIDEEGIFTTGLYNREARKLLLAVWNIHAWKPQTVIDLSKWVPKEATARCVYPEKEADMAVEYAFYPANCKLSVRLPKGLSARLFELTW